MMQPQRSSFRMRGTLVVSVLVMVFASAAQAASVYGTAATLTGSRSVGDGLELVDARKPGAQGDWSNAIIKWEITQNGLLFDYEYTFKNFEGPPAISHIAIDLTDDAVDDPNAVTNVRINGVPVGSGNIEFGDVEGIIGGVKIDQGDPETLPNKVVYSFTSNRSPVWGDISVEAGQEVAPTHYLVQNTGFGNQTLSDVNEYVARPNSVIPAPGAAGAGLMLFAGLFLRRRAMHLRHA